MLDSRFFPYKFESFNGLRRRRFSWRVEGAAVADVRDPSPVLDPSLGEVVVSGTSF